MKTTFVAIMAIAASSAFAQQPVTSANQGNAAAVAPNPADFDKQLSQVQENLRKLQEQETRIQQTQNPQERQRLLQQHWTTMQNAMTTMRGMWGPGMLGCCGSYGAGGHMMGGPMMGGMMGWGNASSYYSNLTPDQLRQRQYMSDQYLATQQQMMGHMMWHQQWLNRVPPARK